MSEGNVRNFGALLQTLEDGQFGAEICTGASVLRTLRHASRG